MALLEMLPFLVLIMSRHLILIIKKTTFQYYRKDQLQVLMIALVQKKENFVFTFSKAKTKFCLILHYNGDESYLYINKTEI